jgi:hypothetical protein
MRDLGREVEYIVAPDEGHGFAGEENRMAFVVAMERFLAGHLGGRYQESVKPEIEEKLADITVPVDSVAMPEMPEGIEEAEKAGFPEFQPEEMKETMTEYSLTVNTAGQEILMSGTETVEKAEYNGTPSFLIRSSQTSSTLNIETELYIRRDNLHPVYSVIKQGPVHITLEYGEDEISGEIIMGGNSMPMSMELDAPVLGSSQLESVIHTLPLEEGFKTTFRTFDLRSRSIQLHSLEVTGTEKVSVPAGDFDAYRIETKSLDQSGSDGVYYVGMNGGRLVKAEISLPASSGGGTAVLEVEIIK